MDSLRRFGRPALWPADTLNLTAARQAINRIAVKTKALDDAVGSQGLRTLKFSGFIDPTSSATKTSSGPASSP